MHVGSEWVCRPPGQRSHLTGRLPAGTAPPQCRCRPGPAAVGCCSAVHHAAGFREVERIHAVCSQAKRSSAPTFRPASLPACLLTGFLPSKLESCSKHRALGIIEACNRLVQAALPPPLCAPAACLLACPAGHAPAPHLHLHREKALLHLRQPATCMTEGAQSTRARLLQGHFRGMHSHTARIATGWEVGVDCPVVKASKVE